MLRTGGRLLLSNGSRQATRYMCRGVLTSRSDVDLKSAPRTLYDKIWDEHIVDDDDGTALIYVDRHLVHEVFMPSLHRRISDPP